MLGSVAIVFFILTHCYVKGFCDEMQWKNKVIHTLKELVDALKTIRNLTRKK